MAKTISFAVIHFTVAFGVAYLLTGSIAIGSAVALIEPMCNTVAFFFHEKFWQRRERNKNARQLRPMGPAPAVRAAALGPGDY
jgi:uncharacterized membrane protein